MGSASTVNSNTLASLNPSVGNNFSSGTALLTSIAILITNEYISKLKIRCTKLKDGINDFTLFYEKTMKTSLVDKKWIVRRQKN